jgi:Zn-dependent peptidase ImmA (M78 family)
MTRIAVSPDMLRWALERSGIEAEKLLGRFKKLPEWETGESLPTINQLDSFARAVHVPIGYLFLSEPPQEPLPIQDFRTFDNRPVRRPSPNLLDTLYICQERQAWYREFAQMNRLPTLDFVGSVAMSASPQDVANDIRNRLGFGLDERRECSTWSDALRLFIQRIDEVGILAMVSGVVMSNNRRHLDPEEFRGFAFADPLAPVLFVNGADTKAAQMFTLAHELAHLWLGTSALSNLGAAPKRGSRREEVWCNAVAAEFLVPLAALRTELHSAEPIDEALARLARIFKVSTLVILRRLLDAGWLDRTAFDSTWAQEIARLRALAVRGSGGGDFYRTTLSRVSRRFARALVVSTLEGQTLYRDAFRMLGVTKTQTFNNIGREVGVMG